jgi:hypothetical protein
MSGVRGYHSVHQTLTQRIHFGFDGAKQMEATISNKIIANATFATAIVAIVGLVSFAPAAHAITYSTSGTAEAFSLGDQMGSASNYDQLIVNGVGPTALTTGTITLNTLDFIAGVNAFTPDTYSYSFDETMTVSNGGGTQTLTVPFNISINTADTLSIAGGNSLSFTAGGSVWDVVLNALTIGPDPGGSMVANLTASVTDPPAAPIPGTLVLFASGLGIIGLIGWRRKHQHGSATAVA